MKPVSELMEIAQWVKRGTRNSDVIDLCDAVEELLMTKPKGPKRDRKAYMRDYMRKWRANKKP